MDTTRLLLAGVLTGCMVWGLSLGVDSPLGWAGLLARVGIPSLVGLAFFGLVGSALGVAEVQEIGTMLRRRMRLLLHFCWDPGGAFGPWFDWCRSMADSCNLKAFDPDA
jgi:hypothetical protein